MEIIEVSAVADENTKDKNSRNNYSMNLLIRCIHIQPLSEMFSAAQTIRVDVGGEKKTGIVEMERDSLYMYISS